MTQAKLLALDWGTTSLRGFLMDGAGGILEQRASPHGIQHLPQPGREGFEAAFAALCGPWLGAWPGFPVVAGGMVGSQQGWAEAPYLRCPADLALLAAKALRIRSRDGVAILIAPGLVSDPADAPPDVMRGEEIQIAGALAEQPQLAAESCVLLPGTHSKWVAVRQGRIQDFATYMTGEVFSVMSRHSILGRLMPDAATEDKAAFAEGVRAAAGAGAGDLLNQMFHARSLGLTRRMPAAALKDYLSGLLIGQELVSGAGRMGPVAAMIGDAALCARYDAAMRVLDQRPALRLGNTAPAGLFGFARAAGLLAPSAAAQSQQ